MVFFMNKIFLLSFTFTILVSSYSRDEIISFRDDFFLITDTSSNSLDLMVREAPIDLRSSSSLSSKQGVPTPYHVDYFF